MSNENDTNARQLGPDQFARDLALTMARVGGSIEQMHKDIVALHDRHLDFELYYLKKDRDTLLSWKESMLKVSSYCNFQAVGRLLGVPLGAQIYEQIEPRVRELLNKLKSTKADAEIHADRAHLYARRLDAINEALVRAMPEYDSVITPASQAVGTLHEKMAEARLALAEEKSYLDWLGIPVRDRYEFTKHSNYAAGFKVYTYFALRTGEVPDHMSLREAIRAARKHEEQERESQQPQEPTT